MRYLIVPWAIVLGGCTPSASVYRGTDDVSPYSRYAAAAMYGRGSQDEPESLFPSDIAVLSDSAIRRILSYRLTLPSKSRVAVLQLGDQQRRWRWWSEEGLRLSEELADTVVQSLLVSPRVARTTILPELLVPRERAVPYLREAAARFQADLLLVFRPQCNVFERARFIGATQFRSTCTVEAVLLDTRSGIVPFSGVASADQVAEKQKTDFGERDTMVKAEVRATRAALAEVTRRIVAFLAEVPETQP